MNRPVLSVVLTVVDGGNALRRCLAALLAQQDAPPLEIVIPIDSTLSSHRWMSELRSAHDGAPVRWLDLGTLPTTRPPMSATGQHELIDRRRAAGLAAARGELIAILEDRGVPEPTWAATAVRLHRELPYAAIGGAVETGQPGLLNRAVYFCDFGRYQRPFVAGPREYVSDVNVAYKRPALEQTHAIWRERYHEPLVHWALTQAGLTLFLSPDLAVVQIRDGLTLRRLIAERFAWGRLFGRIRSQHASLGRRLWWLAAAPVVPVVLFGRFLRDRLRKREPAAAIAAVGPAVALLLSAWAIGEAAGYLAAGSSRPKRD
jgi:hypothetical protein